MNKKVSNAFEAVRDLIDDEGNPKNMSKEEYLEFLEEISADLDARMEAVREELAEE